jgi:hypothetical protein
VNLDDVNFEQEWEKFKETVGSNSFFVIGYKIGGNYKKLSPVFIDVYLDDRYEDEMLESSKRVVVEKMFRIWIQLGLVVARKNKLDHPRYQINPQHLCPQEESIG